MVFNTLDEMAAATAGWPDEKLEEPWKWGSYDSSLRFAYFRIYESLATLAARLQCARVEEAVPLTEVQRLLGHYHGAYRDLEGACRGLDDRAAAAPPAPESWSVTRTYAHIVGADIGFGIAVRYAWRRLQGDDELPEEIPDAAWEEVMPESAYDELMARPLSALRAYHGDLHAALLAEFAAIPDDALGWPARYWEEELYPLRFRLQRFDAHVRQHVIQIEKVRQALDRPLSETQRLLRIIDRARAEVENALLGAPAGWHAALLTSAEAELQRYAAVLLEAAR